MTKRRQLLLPVSTRDTATGRIVVESVLVDHPDWVARAEIDDSGEAADVVSVTLVRRDLTTTFGSNADGTPYEASGTATTSMLRAIKLTELVSRANLHLEAWRSPRRVPDPGKVPTNSPKYYARWAARYVNAARSGSRSPVADLATEHDLDRPKVRDLIHECRRKGYLTAGRHGAAGGELTPLALEQLGITTTEEDR